MEKNEKQFAHLHVHTEYSLLDGAIRHDEIFQRCGELNMLAVAITDHGNMYGVIEFVKKAVKYTDPTADFYEFMEQKREFKVKPIVGCELYVAPDMTVRESRGGKMPKFAHLVLLCKNEIGYRNLIHLVSKSFTEGFYYKPRIDMKLLKEHCEGLVCLSACLAGELPQAILAGDIEKAESIAAEFKALFGDDYYIEIQDHNISDQKKVLPHLISIARKLGIKLVATNDAHYINKSDSAMQKVLQCISFRTTLPYESENESDTMSAAAYSDGDGGYFPTKEFYIKSRAEMEQVFPLIPEALDNTLEVAAKCDCHFFKKEMLYPSFKTPKGESPSEYLRQLTYEGLKAKYKEITPEITERADYELSIIHNMGFSDYFLIVWDFIHFAESRGIPVGPGRGSGVGSIVAYAIGITKVNPLKYALFFERFLNPERVSSPDFDIDFCVDRRGEVIDYVVNKYGDYNVSQIITFGTLAPKAAIKDVARVYNLPYSEADKITKLMPGLMGKRRIGDIVGIYKAKDGENAVIPELRDMYNKDAVTQTILDMAMKIEGMPRQTGMHAAGVIICKDPIFEHIPLALSSENTRTTQFNMIECEELGLLKMDFLGLTTLTDIKKAVDIIKKTRGIDIDFYNMEYDDIGVFELIGEGDTHAVFQLESEGMKRFMRDLKPTTLEEIIAGIALYRPGPMDKIGDYIFYKRNPDKIQYDHPLLESIMNVTYGIMVYQEQAMMAAQVVAGYTPGRADELRRIMSKKKYDKMVTERQVFLHGISHKGIEIPGAIQNGVSEEAANRIFDNMTSFASYAFNKSHATAYAYLAYQTAYLKRYYTVEFVAAVLNNRINKIDEIKNYLSYLKEKEIMVLPPDINRSAAEFTVEDGAVRIGMAAIKNVGMAVIEEIVAERERGGEFTDFVQFVNRMDNVNLNKKNLESLIFSGTFDCFGKTRAQLIQVYESVLSRAAKDRDARRAGQFSFFDNGTFSADEVFVCPAAREYPLADKLKYEKEVAGVYLTGHPLDEYKKVLKSYSFNTSMLKQSSEDSLEDEEVGDLSALDGKTVTLGGMLIEATKRFTKNGQEIGIGKLEDFYGAVDVLLSSRSLNTYKKLWQEDKFVVITGKVKIKEGFSNIWIDKIEEIDASLRERGQNKICFYLSFSESYERVIDSMTEILKAYPGDDDAYIKNTDDNTLFPLGIKTYICDLLLGEFYGLLGEKNVKAYDQNNNEIRLKGV